VALTKHQKLAREMKHNLEALEIHYQKTASMLNALLFHFYETHLIIGRPLILEKAFKTMMRTHKFALGLFAPNEELRCAARQSPLIGFVITPRFYPQPKILISSSTACKDDKWYIPWGVKIVLPKENLRKLEDTKLEALLYCASRGEMSEWLDWFQNEDKAASLTNQMLLVQKDLQDKAAFEKNILQLAMPFYQQSVLEYFKLPKGKQISKSLLTTDFAPQENSSIADAYRLVSESLSKHKKRHFEDFQRFWRDWLEDLMLGWTPIESDPDVFFKEYFPFEIEANKEKAKPRWETGRALDRQTYGAFIRYFIDIFITDSLKRKTEGEIVLLLWVMIYVARDLKKPTTIKKLLELNTSNVADRDLIIDDEEIELSRGLANLIKEYTGRGSLQRQQKLFPNLTIDKLEDHLHRASKAILPLGSVLALPEAFLTFPHPEKNCRINPQVRRDQLRKPSKILHDPISLNELKRQLIEKAESQPA